MRWPGVVTATPLLAALLAALFALAPGHPASVYACSAGPDWDPVAESEVIVAGRITGWEKSEAADVPAGFPFQPIRVQMVVERVYKGAPVTAIDFVDVASLSEQYSLPGTGADWHGSSGACGAFNADPAGSYAVLGLHRNSDGELRSNLLTTFFIGSAPEGERYEQALERLRTLGVERLPVTGTGPLAGDRAPDGRLLVPGVAVLLLLGGVGLAARGFRRT